MNATLQVIGTKECATLIVEPWAEEVALKGGVTYEIVATAKDMPWFQVEPRATALIVHVNGRHATFEVQRDGEAIAGSDVPTPT